MGVASLITLACTVVVALATLWMAARAEHKSAQAVNHLEGNGKGTVPEMLEKLVVWTERHDAKHEILDDIVLRGRPWKNGQP